MPAPNEIRVRLVPKSPDGGGLNARLSDLLPGSALKVSPDRDRAHGAFRQAMSMHLDAAVTPTSRVDVLLHTSRFEEVFKSPLVAKQQEKQSGYFSSGSDEYFAPARRLEVPEDLQETIAFAYMPTPPRFFAPSFVPPITNNYHLRIEDVVRAVRASQCHRCGWTGRGVRIAMADTGFARHPYFDHYGFNIHRIHTPSTSHPAIDNSGHGTGESANALAIAPDCTFYGIKHNDFSAEALETALDQSPHVLTNSWGWDIDHLSKEELKTENENLYFELIDVENILLAAIDDGVIVVFSGGNGQRPFPACIPQVLAVGGVTVNEDGSLEASNYASSFRSKLYPGRAVPDICGVVGRSGAEPQEGHIMLPVPQGSDLEGKNMTRNSEKNKGWGVFSGTSAAAPQVAGVIALVLSVKPDLNQAQLRYLMSDSAVDVTEGLSSMGEAADIGVDNATGPGLVDAMAACLRAQSL